MRIKAVLWDIDGTLLNFKKAQYVALYKCFAYFNKYLDDEMVDVYDHINHAYWLMLEKGEISKNELLVKRFVDFFDKYDILIDPVSFNEMYQVELGNTYVFNDNGYETVKALKDRGIIQFAITNGTKTAQDGKLRGSGLIDILDEIFISEDVGYEKPDRRFFEPVAAKLKEYGIDKSECIIVGDSESSDMALAKNVGISGYLYKRDIMNLKEVLDIKGIRYGAAKEN
ncbi:MAG: HAD-IA family hydrolase [Erysipelotrichaceae bacterium]|nr:HAD-IA family hydrolase [Erysipelotrichaceae bacterium]